MTLDEKPWSILISNRFLTPVPPKKSVLVVSTGVTQRWFEDRCVLLHPHEYAA
jgi:hypothetical protein